jgi:hypothetical protein
MVEGVGALLAGDRVERDAGGLSVLHDDQLVEPFKRKDCNPHVRSRDLTSALNGASKRAQRRLRTSVFERVVRSF